MSVARHWAARKPPSGAERIGAVRGSRSRTDIEGTLGASTRTTPPSYAGRRSIGRGQPRSGFECRVYGDQARWESFGRVMPAFDKDPCGLRFPRYRPGPAARIVRPQTYVFVTRVPQSARTTFQLCA